MSISLINIQLHYSIKLSFIVNKIEIEESMLLMQKSKQGMKAQSFSKVGRYISNKLVKRNWASQQSSPRTQRKTFNHQDSKLKKSQFNSQQKFNNQTRNSFEKDKTLITAIESDANDSKKSTEKKKLHKSHQIHQSQSQRKYLNELPSINPPVGTYKIKYDAVEKNVHTYNFNRSVPHFHRQKYNLNSITPAFKDIPDGLQQTIKGFTDFNRIVGRDSIKGSIRKTPENPHQERFILKQNKVNMLDRTIDFEKMSARDQKFFQPKITPTYIFDDQKLRRRLDSHVLHFQKQGGRSGEFFYSKTGISNSFNSAHHCIQSKQSLVPIDKQLQKQNHQTLPSHMSATFSRMSLSSFNFKTMEMNCSVEIKPKIKRKQNPKNYLQYQNISMLNNELVQSMK